MTERPALPPVVPGRSALPAFLAVEAEMRVRLAAAREAAEARLEAAKEKAAEVERMGKDELRQAVVDAEQDAIRDVEQRAIDRVSEARRLVEDWVRRCEASIDDIVAEALAQLTRAPAREAALAED